MHKTPTFVGFGRGDWLAVLPPIILERLIPELEPSTCPSWRKVLAIESRLEWVSVCSML